MTSKYLSPITTEENTVPREGVIAINTSIPGDPYLEVWTSGKWVPVNDSNTQLRMARFDDFYTAMVEVDWLTGGRIWEDEEGSYHMVLGNYESSLPEISPSDPMIKISGFENSEEDKEDLEKLFTKLLKVKTMEEKEIDLGTGYYRHVVSTRNLIDRSTMIDVLSPESGEYRNILNLNELLVDEEQPYTFKLEVRYIKSGSKHSETMMFDLSQGDEGVTQTNLNDDVLVEIKSGCVRLFPTRPEVTECVIHHCYLIYEKLL